MTRSPHRRVDRVTEARVPVSRLALIVVGIQILAFVVFSKALHHGILAFDDNEYFENYEVLHFSWKSLTAYFSHHYVLMYQPLPVASYALSYSLFGLDPFPLHLLNVLVHVADVALVFAFAYRLSKRVEVATSWRRCLRFTR